MNNQVKELNSLIYEKLGIMIKDEQELENSFRQIGIDSLKIIALISEIEEVYGIQFMFEELDEMDCLKDLYSCLKDKLERK